MIIDLLNKEEIASEKRYWLRTTRRCNNHCLFCHDSEVQNGEIIETQKLKKEIEEASKSGYTRLILSGGEPTLHPDIFELIKFAKVCGFNWIQIITNGRMFAYSDFTNKAIASGLNEVTISFHSYIERISERLTDIKGSFTQTIMGINNLKKYNIVLSLDIVINNLNIKHLKDTIEFFHNNFNITEFDLLHLTPFGRAFENYKILKVEPYQEMRALKEAIDYAQKNNIVIWTNRVPPNLLEENEEYIQDPHKILDEIYGRSEIFKHYLENGILQCRNIKRCKDCFVYEFCEFLIEIRTRFLKRRIERIEITTQPNKKLIERIFDHITHNATIIVSPEYLSSLRDELIDSHKNIILKASDISKIEKIIKEFGCRAVISDNIEIMNLKDIKAKLILDQKNINQLNKIKGLELIFPNSPDIKTEFEKVPDISKTKKVISKYNLNISNLPRCISKEHYREHFYFFRSDFIDENGFVLSNIAEDYLLNRNYHKSLRCNKCIYFSQCSGIHINHLRRFGFKILKPIKI